jgi:DNA modification methylase
MIEHFDSSAFSGIVLDESSRLKSFEGKQRKQFTDFASSIPFRLACTATPAPNDLIELTNHAEFLGIMSGKEIIALFFTQDGNTTHAWRLKGHARQEFWRWMASWSVAMRKPSDLGYSDDGFVLPPLKINQVTVDAPAPEGMLFSVEALDLVSQRAARRASLEDRVEACAELVNGSKDAWIVWCELNDESEALARAIPDAVEVRGSDSREFKETAIRDFIDRSVRVIVSKSSIFGFGLNLQHCHHVAFVGVSHSYEQWYQAIRRCWRFGQKEPVSCYVIASDADGPIVRNLERKEQQASEMMAQIVQHMAGLSLGRQGREEMDYAEETAQGKDWTLYLGDCVDRMGEIEDESVGLIVFSPPFPGMYAYTNSSHDMGNCRDNDEMLRQYAYVIPELLRVTKPGRSCCVHLTQSVAFKGTDGYIGLKDFRGSVIKAMEDGGWVYYGEVCIDKNPQLKAIRTKDQGLLFKTLSHDSSKLHMALADYMLQFRKPGDNEEPILAAAGGRYKGVGWITPEEWIEWAAPVWYRADRGIPGGIRETDVLNVAQARETDDERHLAPLQLGVIERAVKLWSAPGDLVLSPFAGIGSEGYMALKLKRRFVGIELKRSYWESAIRNLHTAENEGQQDLFSYADASA